MPCFESEIPDKIQYDEKAEKAFWDGNKLGINPMVSKAFYTKAKGLYDEAIANNQKADFNSIVAQMSKDSGLREETVARVLTADKRLKAMTTDMWIKQARHRDLLTAAENLKDQADTSEWSKRATQIWDSSRRVATLGHGGVFPFTHARNLLFSGDPVRMKIFAKMVKDAYSYATPRVGRARWERDMAIMQTSQAYREALRAGVEVKPSAEPVGILASGVKGWGRRGFDALKPGRVELFKHLKDQLPENMRDEESARQLGKEVNYATGAIKLGRGATRVLPKVSFAPKLWLSRRMEAFAPIRYLAKAGKMAPKERAVANIALKNWAKTVAVTAGLLEASDAFNKYVLKNDKRVNWSDFSRPGTLWRMNIGGWIIPLSPMVEVIRTPVAMIGALMATKRQLHGEAPLSLAGQVAMKDVLNAIHPSITGSTELITGREVFGKPGHLRRLPFPGVAQLIRGEEPEKDKPLSYPEYFAEKGPIPLAAGTREFVQALQDEGLSQSTSEIWVKALLQSALSGGAGVHVFEDTGKKVSGRPKMEKEP